VANQAPESQKEPGGESGQANLSELVADARQLVVAYARQETLEPLKGLGRYVAFGLAGSAALAMGAAALVVAGLRALQTETGTAFAGKLTWVPYAICAAGSLLVATVAVAAAMRRPGRD
jgi:hypothetical protein